MQKASGFRIKRSDRVFVVGTTGSGKTSLSKALLYGSPDVVVLDPKRTFELPETWEHTTYFDLSSLTNHKGPSTAIYRPIYSEMEAKDPCEGFFKWAFARGNTLIYVDEIVSVVNETRIGESYRAVLQLGREKNVACWSATQRPANIPKPILSESEHYFVFRMRTIEDRKRIYDYTGRPEFLQPIRDEHGFYYYNDRTGQIKYYKKANLGKVQG